MPMLHARLKSILSAFSSFGVRQYVRKIAYIFFGLTALIGIQVTLLVASGNFHTVVKGELYRTAQPSAARLTQLIGDYRIKSVINLRGRHAEKKWYKDEVAVTSALNISHIDFRMSSSRQMSPHQTAELIRIMHDAPKPILLHCDHGINRAGLASALYLAANKKGTENESEMQLSPLYGYWPIFFLPTYAMHESWEDAEHGFEF